MVEQLSIFLENKPGKIATVTASLSEAGIDIRALSIADTTDFGILRMLVSDTQRAKDILQSQNCMVVATEVVVVAVPDVAGGLALVLGLMDNANIDIEYMYSLIGRGEDKAYMVFRVSDNIKLLSLLGEHHLDVVSRETLGII